MRYETYEKQFQIVSSEIDAWGNCRPSALLAFFQDTANIHSELQHMDRDTLMEECGAVWMLARIWLRLDRPLKQEETVTVRTWHRGAGGATVYRDFDLIVDGKPVGEAVSAWVVADLLSRKMLRPKNVAHIAAAAVPETVKEKQLTIIRAPQGRELVYQKTVRVSDLDVNGHMNNTRYADVLMDAMTPEEFQGKFIAEMQLNYSKECLAGETMDICRKMEGDRCYIDGCGGDGSRRFEAILQFRGEPGNCLDAGEVSE